MWAERQMAEIRAARLRELQLDTDDEEELADQKNRQEEEEQERRRLEREQRYLNEFRKAPRRAEHEEVFQRLRQQEQLEKRVLERYEYQRKEAEILRRQSQAEDPEVQRGEPVDFSDDELVEDQETSLVRAAVLGAEQAQDKFYLHIKGAEIKAEFQEKKMQIQDVSLEFLQALDVAGNAKERRNTFLLLHEFIRGQQKRGVISLVVQFFNQLERLNLPVQEKRYYASFVRHPVPGDSRPSFFMELGGEGDDDDDAQSSQQFLAEWCERMCPLPRPSQAPTVSPKRQKTEIDRGQKQVKD